MQTNLRVSPCVPTATYESMPIMSPMQDTKRSHQQKKGKDHGRMTVPLPLAIVMETVPAGNDGYGFTNLTAISDGAGGWKSVQNIGNESEIQKTKASPPEDPWLIRERVLALVDGSVEAIDRITSVYGGFGLFPNGIHVPPHYILEARPGSTQFKQLFNSELLEWRSLIRAAMTTEMSNWPDLKGQFAPQKVNQLCAPMALTIDWRNGRPKGIVSCSGILPAVIATVKIDALLDAEYRFCACVGCPKNFKVKRKDQRYCSDACKHKQVVRDGRVRQREAAQQASIRIKGREKS